MIVKKKTGTTTAAKGKFTRKKTVPAAQREYEVGYKKPPPAKMGRPTKYISEYNEQVYKLCLVGATDEQLAVFFSVDKATINRWKKRYPDFRASLKKGKIQADAQVAESLFHKAKGYSHPETKFFCHEGEVIPVETVKHYPPDTGACALWLKNRAGWADRKDHKHESVLTVQDLIVMMGGTGDQ